MAKPTQKYLFLHHSEPGHGEGKPSPEQMQAMFAKWSAWSPRTRALGSTDGRRPRAAAQEARGSVAQ